MIADYIEELRKMPLFAGIKSEEMMSMMGCIGAFEKNYRKNEIVHLYSEQVKYIGIVLAGNIHMMQEDLWGNATMLVNVNQWELFGETFVGEEHPDELVTFLAMEDSKILLLPFHRVMHSCNMSCSHHHELIKNMVLLIAKKNIRLMEKIDVMSKKTLREKITAYITRLAKEQNCMEVELPMGRIKLAQYLNIDRSALTRELGRMQEEGLIEIQKKNIKILEKLY